MSDLVLVVPKEFVERATRYMAIREHVVVVGYVGGDWHGGKSDLEADFIVLWFMPAVGILLRIDRTESAELLRFGRVER